MANQIKQNKILYFSLKEAQDFESYFEITSYICTSPHVHVFIWREVNSKAVPLVLVYNYITDSCCY